MLKFRAVITKDIKLNSITLFFTFRRLLKLITEPMHPDVKMLLLPWIKEGNEPDRFTQFQDNNGKNIYENDILDWGENIVGQVCYGHKGWEFRYWHDDPRSFSFDDNGNYIYDKVEEIVSLDEVCMGGAIIVSIISNTHKIPGDMANSND